MQFLAFMNLPEAEIQSKERREADGQMSSSGRTFDNLCHTMFCSTPVCVHHRDVASLWWCLVKIRATGRNLGKGLLLGHDGQAQLDGVHFGQSPVAGRARAHRHSRLPLGEGGGSN